MKTLRPYQVDAVDATDARRTAGERGMQYAEAFRYLRLT